MTSIYTFSDYKQYLTSYLEEAPHSGHGIRSKWAKVMGCHTTYVSQVLRGNGHLSLEQALQLSQHLGLDEASERFFLLLVNYARAGTEALRTTFQRDLDQMREIHLTLSSRIKDNTKRSDYEHARYYSAWYFAALHVASSVPALRNINRLGQIFELSPRRLLEALECLRELGLIDILPNGVVKQTTKSLHLDKTSALAAKHHINWRLQAIRAVEQEGTGNFHYSSVVSLAEGDLPHVKAVLIDAIEKIRAIVRESKEEKVYAYTADLFSVLKD